MPKRRDDPLSVATDPSAPEAERFDAQAELAKAHRPDSAAVAQAAAVVELLQAHFEDEALFKAGSANSAFDQVRAHPTPREGMRSVWLDEMQTQLQGEYYEKPTGLSMKDCRDIVERTPVLSAIVRTRVAQVLRFAQPSEDGGPGFEIRHQERGKKLAGDDLNAAKELTRFLQNCGWEQGARRRKRLKRGNFAEFIIKSATDSLSMDACPIETEMTRDGERVDGFYAVDGSTVRLCTENGYQGDDEIYALQVIDGRIVTSYTYEELIYQVRNPRTDVRVGGYGFAEPEVLARVVTGYLNAMSYNIAGFDQNSIPKGILNITGSHSKEDQVEFRRYWNMMVKGVQNAHSLPVMFTEDAEGKVTFERFGVDFNEMAFSKWMTFLTALACAIYEIAPDEINFESFAASSSSLSGSDTAEKLSNSKDKGLRPLMAFYESTITDYMITEMVPHLCMRWAGLDEEDPDQKWEREKLTLTVDEMRSRNGDEPYPDPLLGTAPINPSLMGAWQQKAMPQQQPEGQRTPDFGQDGDGSEFGEPPADAEDRAAAEEAGDDAKGAGGQPAEQLGEHGEGELDGDGESFGKALRLDSIFAFLEEASLARH